MPSNTLKPKVSYQKVNTHTLQKTENAKNKEEPTKLEDIPTLEEDKLLPYKKPSLNNQLQLLLMLLTGLPIKEESSLDVEQA